MTSENIVGRNIGIFDTDGHLLADRYQQMENTNTNEADRYKSKKFQGKR